MVMSGASPLGAGTGPHVFVADLDHPDLEPDDRHHLQRVLRIREGEAFTASDGQGRWRPCRFTDPVTADGEIVTVAPAEPTLTIGFALVKGERPELVVQKLTELGIDRIVPFVARRSVVRWDGDRADRNVARLRRVAREAAMQCRRVYLPIVEAVVPFDQLLGADVALAQQFGPGPSLARTTVLIGPEGGWDPDEVARSVAKGVGAVGLGPHVLRAETAAVTAGALLAGLRSGLVQSAADEKLPPD